MTIAGGTTEADDGRADTSISGLGLWTFDEVSNSGDIDVIVSGGMGVGSKENFQLIYDLAEVLGVVSQLG